MKRNIIFYFLFSCLFLFSDGLLAQQKDTLKVLFVGNSYTYFWNLPQTVHLLAASKGIPIITRQSTVGGAYWGEHWRGDRGLKTKALIENGDWDIVVLQNNSLSALERPDSFLLYGKRLGELIKASGAKPVLYLTWAREFNPLMQEKITAAYKELAKDIGATIAPVGPAWAMARSLRPDLRLYHPDRSHPSTFGTYLTGCVFFRTLTGQAAQGLAERLMTEDKDGEPLYINILTPEDAGFLQQVVDKVFQSF